MPQGGARGQNLGHLKFFFSFYFSLMLSIIFKEQILLRVDFLPLTSDSRVFFFAFLSFAGSFVVEQQTLFGVDLIHISMISDIIKFNTKVGEWGPGLRFKSRIFRICLYLRKDTSRGYTCLSGHFF